MGFKEHKQPKLSAVSQEILSYWEEESIFEKSITSREGQPPFVFYEGPPSANGMPGIHPAAEGQHGPIFGIVFLKF